MVAALGCPTGSTFPANVGWAEAWKISRQDKITPREEKAELKRFLVNTVRLLASRRTLWRLGRALYLEARADVNNDMDTNGEKKIQHCIIKNLVNKGEDIIFFDVGANIGSWTVSALDNAASLRVDKRLEVHTFEPAPDTFRTLQCQMKEHQVSDKTVHLVNQALSSAEGNAEMFIVGENAGTNSLHEDAMESTLSRTTIELTTGDKYCSRNGINKIHFIKCDAEGHDMDVLLGFKCLIEAEKIMVFQFEYNHRWIYSRHYLKDVFDFIGNHRYRIAKITPDTIELYEGWHPELERFFEGNYLIIHENVLKWFDVTCGKFDVFDTYG